ncbi:MAG: alpha/beta hydrolase [Burkholderiales bacterium]|nr:alpha/beta hydrolase [Burkholderiales bacterium]
MSVARLVLGGRELSLEYEWVGSGAPGAPVVVFLHEGLGSRAMWRDFPARQCAALHARGLVYSRPGYGGSTPKPPGERWPVEFMHRQAYDVLPAFLASVGAPARPWLFGHSDGASIALLYAAKFPDGVAGVIAVAPHLFVEDVSVRSIEAARVAYETGDLRARLGRYHDDPDSAFRGWNDAWLDPAFRAWNIEAEAAGVRCPVLAVQGVDDEYGTMAQVGRLAALAPRVSLVKLADCGHSPHRDQPRKLIDAVSAFVLRASGAGR